MWLDRKLRRCWCESECCPCVPAWVICGGWLADRTDNKEVWNLVSETQYCQSCGHSPDPLVLISGDALREELTFWGVTTVSFPVQQRCCYMILAQNACTSRWHFPPFRMPAFSLHHRFPMPLVVVPTECRRFEVGQHHEREECIFSGQSARHEHIPAHKLSHLMMLAVANYHMKMI